MRIALCQVNSKIHDFIHNVDKLVDFSFVAKEKSADIALFPELSLCGYPPLDLLDHPDFLKKSEESLETFKKVHQKQKDKMPRFVLLGTVKKSDKTFGKDLLNVLVVLDYGKEVHTQAKRLLPTYDIFDEARYFEPAETSQLWHSPFGKIGLTICEDLWFEQTEKRRYAKDPVEDLKNADFILNASASPFEQGKRESRKKLLSNVAKRAKSKLFYVNSVGANDEFLFDGLSYSIDASGKILSESKAFEEGITICSTDDESATFSKYTKSKMPDFSINKNDENELIYKAIVTGISDYFRKTGFTKAILGLSGGIDSALVATLATHALGKENVTGIAMPSQYSSSHSLNDAQKLAQNLGIEYLVHPIKFLFSSTLMELKPSFQGKAADVTEENLQSRLRGLIVAALSNKRNALVLTTGNKSELAVGYCTIYGDMIGALAPIGDLYKSKVYELSRWINKTFGEVIPASSIEKAPSAELRPGQKDQDSLPEYVDLDFLLERLFENKVDENQLFKDASSRNISKEVVEKVRRLVLFSEFKRRQAAPSLRLTSKAFGLGRRIPIAKS
jgi:NAD+ synthase (glutamine-hydrolysing)